VSVAGRYDNVSDHLDIIETDGGRDRGDGRAAAGFLSVWYQCCHTYGRLTRNREGTKYEGRCPRCGSRVQALIGPDGTSRRMFTAM
jgi:hypothetical protein